MYTTSNVGFGVSNPQFPLDVASNLRVQAAKGNAGMSLACSYFPPAALYPEAPIAPGTPTSNINGITYTFTNDGPLITWNAYYSAYLFDQAASTTSAGNFNSSTGNYTGTAITGTVPGAWMQMQTSAPIVITGYSLSINPIPYPTKIYIMGSTDGATWTQVGSSQIATWTSGSNASQFSFPNSVANTYHRFVVNQISSNWGTAFTLIDLRFAGYPNVVGRDWRLLSASNGDLQVYDQADGAVCMSVTPAGVTAANMAIVASSGNASLALTNSSSYTSTASTQYPTAPIAVGGVSSNIAGITYTFLNDGGWANGLNAGYVFDQTTSYTYAGPFNSNTGYYSGSNTTGFAGGYINGTWIQMQTSTPLVITGYSISVYSTPDPYPTKLYMFGSLDGTVWAQVNYTTLATWTTGSGPTQINFANTVPYTYHRVAIAQISLGNTLIAVNDIRFTGYPQICGQDWRILSASNGDLQMYDRTANAVCMSVSSAGNVRVAGTLSKGAGTFDIPHPVAKDGTRLVHSFIEGPRADLIYSGKAVLRNGAALVDLNRQCTGNGSTMMDGTFEALCRDPRVFVANNATWDRVRGSVDGCMLAVESDNPSASGEVEWMVVAERQDNVVRSWDRTDGNGQLVLEYMP